MQTLTVVLIVLAALSVWSIAVVSIVIFMAGSKRNWAAERDSIMQSLSTDSPATEDAH